MDARERILKAATEVFVEKGLAGARMQEIADRAEVNKAMLHYYFTSKEHLYEAVIVTTLTKVMTGMQGILYDAGLSFEERLRRFVAAYFDGIREHGHMPRLVMQDLMAGGERVADYFGKAAEQAGFIGGLPVVAILEDGVRSGEVRCVDPKQAIISLVGMVVFFFLARPILSAVLRIDLEGRNYERFLEERKNHVMDLFLHGVLAGRTHADSRVEIEGGRANA